MAIPVSYTVCEHLYSQRRIIGSFQLAFLSLCCMPHVCESKRAAAARVILRGGAHTSDAPHLGLRGALMIRNHIYLVCAYGIV